MSEPSQSNYCNCPNCQTKDCPAGIDFAALQRKLSEAERERDDAVSRVTRYHDLVRYARMALHEAELVTDEEYAELLSDSKAVGRLEGYDKLQQELAAAKVEIERLRALPNISEDLPGSRVQILARLKESL